MHPEFLTAGNKVCVRSPLHTAPEKGVRVQTDQLRVFMRHSAKMCLGLHNSKQVRFEVASSVTALVKEVHCGYALGTCESLVPRHQTDQLHGLADIHINHRICAVGTCIKMAGFHGSTGETMYSMFSIRDT